jgi:hypothetical protein
MTTATLYDALEICLQALEQGTDVEACLVRFPALADELRPILETAVQARSAAVTEIPPAAIRRGKARVLQAAAEMREQAGAPRRNTQFGRMFRLMLASLAMVAFLLTGGTGLVRAASTTLPGDSLYPVKRGWEGVRLLLVVDPKSKNELETEFEQERVQEIQSLFSKGRMEQVNFQGAVDEQHADYWQIAGLRIAVDHETKFNGGAIVPGSLVQVIGETDDGIIKAERINLITLPVATFTPQPSLTTEPIFTNTPELRATETEREPPEITNTPDANESPEVTDTTEAPQSETQQPEVTETKEPPQSETQQPEPTETSKSDKNGGDDSGGGDG